MQHGGPEQGVEVNDVLADEVVQLGLGVRIPVGVEIQPFAVAKVFEAGHVADRRIQPDIEVFAGFTGDLEAPVGRVAGNVPIGQAGFEPFVEFVGDFGLHMAAVVPILQGPFEIAQFEKQVFRGFFDGRRPGQGGDRVFHLQGRIGRAALFAGVAVLVGRATTGTFAFYEPVRQEHPFFRIVGLAYGPAGDVVLVPVAGVDQFGEMAVFRGMGGVVVVERDAETGEIPLVFPVHAFDQIRG